MGLWKNIKSVFAGDMKQESNTNANSWDGHSFHFSNWADSNFWGSHSQVLRTNEEIFGVISRLANTLSSLPIHEYQNYSETSDEVSELLTGESNPSIGSIT